MEGKFDKTLIAAVRKGLFAASLREATSEEVSENILSSLSETYALVPLKVCRAAREALYGVIGLIDESRGVVGWHLNGNEVLWSEFNYPTELVKVVEQLNKCLPEEEAE
jgi:hypothetical protein